MYQSPKIFLEEKKHPSLFFVLLFLFSLPVQSEVFPDLVGCKIQVLRALNVGDGFYSGILDENVSKSVAYYRAYVDHEKFAPVKVEEFLTRLMGYEEFTHSERMAIVHNFNLLGARGEALDMETVDQFLFYLVQFPSKRRAKGILRLSEIFDPAPRSRFVRQFRKRKFSLEYLERRKLLGQDYKKTYDFYKAYMKGSTLGDEFTDRFLKLLLSLEELTHGDRVSLIEEVRAFKASPADFETLESYLFYVSTIGHPKRVETIMGVSEVFSEKPLSKAVREFRKRRKKVRGMVREMASGMEDVGQKQLDQMFKTQERMYNQCISNMPNARRRNAFQFFKRYALGTSVGMGMTMYLGFHIMEDKDWHWIKNLGYNFFSMIISGFIPSGAMGGEGALWWKAIKNFVLNTPYNIGGAYAYDGSVIENQRREFIAEVEEYLNSPEKWEKIQALTLKVEKLKKRKRYKDMARRFERLAKKEEALLNPDESTKRLMVEILSADFYEERAGYFEIFRTGSAKWDRFGWDTGYGFFSSIPKVYLYNMIMTNLCMDKISLGLKQFVGVSIMTNIAFMGGRKATINQ